MRKLVLLISMAMLAAGVFSQDAGRVSKHEPFDMMLGLNFGSGVTPNIGAIGRLVSEPLPVGNYAITFDFGLTYDFYLFSWLSFNTGVLLHPDIYLLWDEEMEDVEMDNFSDYAATPLCLTIPIMAHVNIPKVEWLYLGIGLNFNFPLFSILDSVMEAAGAGEIDTKGGVFIGLPIDIGFDFVTPGRGGGRLIFRITPEFHKEGAAVPVGVIWQIYNWKIK